MPADWVMAASKKHEFDLTDDDDLRALAEKFGLSAQSMAKIRLSAVLAD